MTIGSSSPAREPTTLLGRQPELSTLSAHLSSVLRNGAEVMVVGGEPGIGKTTLLAAFAERCAPSARSVAVRCSPYDVDGLQPIHRLITALDPDHPSPPPETTTWSPPTDPDQARAQRAEQLAALLAALLDRVGATPTVLVIDDVHWGQTTLHEFLAYAVDAVLARRLHHQLLVVLVTRILPPPHPISTLLADLERHLGVVRLELGPLDHNDVEQLVTSAGPSHRPSPAYVDLVQRSARGNPLRAQAALRVLGQRRIDPAIRPSDRRAWGAIRLAPELDDPVTAWINDLSPAVRASLTAGAVWGDEFTPADLAPLVDDPDQVPHHLDHAVTTDLLGTDGHGFWFGHPSFREVVLELADGGFLQTLHARAAARLLPDPGSAIDPAPPTDPAPAHDDATARRAGHHLLAAAELLPGPVTVTGLLAAGYAAHRAFAWTESSRYLEAARQLGPTVQADPAQRAELLVALGQAYYFDHDYAAALPVLDDAIEIAAAANLESPWAAALLTWLRITMVTRTQALARVPPGDRARHFLDTATDPSRRSLIRQALAEQHITAGDTDTGAHLAQQALADADEGGDPVARAFALYAVSFADQADLRLTSALLGIHASRAEAHRSGDWWVQDIMQARLALYLLSAGQIDEADDEARAAVEAATRRQEHSNHAIGAYVQTAAALIRGDFDSFDPLVARTRREAERSGYVLTELWTAAASVLGHIYRGDPTASRQAAECWPNPLPSGLAAFRSAPALLGLPGPVTLRPPRRISQISIGFYAASVEAAICAGVSDGLADAADLLERCTAHGFEYPATWPTSLTRIRAELALALGRPAEAHRLFDEAVRRAGDSGAQLELARSLAGTARLVSAHGDTLGAAPEHAADTALRARALASLIGLDPRILRLDPPPTGGPTAAVGTPAVVLVTDIVGSTALSRTVGDLAYFELVTAHFELVRTSLRRWSGREFSDSGDGMLAWFERIEPAVAAAHEIRRRALAASGDGRLGIKVSLAAGPTLLRAGRPYGLLPSLACRLLDNAHPNEIVVDATLAATLPHGFTVAEHRPVDLRGIGPHLMAVLAPAPAQV